MMTATNKKATGYHKVSNLSVSLSSSHYPLPNQYNSTNDVFPVKLYRLLEETTKNGYDDLISWSPDGMSFKVHDTEQFSVEIMPSYFGSNKYRSFQKNLNMWAFKYAERRGKCYHPLFRRGMPHLICQMQRQLVKHQIERQHKREVKTRKAAEIPKQRQHHEASMDTGLHPLKSSTSDVNQSNFPAAYPTAECIMDKVQREQEQYQQSILSPSVLLLAEIHKKIDEMRLSQEQQQWLHHYHMPQARGPSSIEDDISIELHRRRGRFRATQDFRGVCPTRGDDMTPLIISSLLDAITTTSPEMRRQEGIADYSSISFGNANTANGVGSYRPCGVIDGLLSGVNGGLMCLLASLAANYASTAAAESSPLSLSQLRDIFARKFLLQSYKEQGNTGTTRLDIHNDIHTRSTTRRNPSFSRLHRPEKERLRTLVPPTVFLSQEQPKLHTTPFYGRSSSLSSSSSLLPSYEDLLLQYILSSNHQQPAELSINTTTNSTSNAVAGSFCAPPPTAGSAFSAAVGVSKAGQTRTTIANFIAAQKN